MDVEKASKPAGPAFNAQRSTIGASPRGKPRSAISPSGPLYAPIRDGIRINAEKEVQKQKVFKLYSLPSTPSILNGRYPVAATRPLHLSRVCYYVIVEAPLALHPKSNPLKLGVGYRAQHQTVNGFLNSPSTLFRRILRR